MHDDESTTKPPATPPPAAAADDTTHVLAEVVVAHRYPWDGPLRDVGERYALEAPYLESLLAMGYVRRVERPDQSLPGEGRRGAHPDHGLPGEGKPPTVDNALPGRTPPPRPTPHKGRS